MRFRKPELVPLLFIIAATLTLGSFGVWQLQRLAWKENLLAGIEKAQSLPALERLPPDMSGLEYRSVSLYGTFLHDKALRVVSAPQGQVQGFKLFVPLKLNDGRMILVNRGFSPEGKALQLAGVQNIRGILRPGREKRPFTPDNQPDNNLWFYEDISAMAAQTGLTLLPLVVEVVGPREAGVYPMPSEGKIVFRNDHLGYAITWFSLCLIGIIMFAVYHRVEENT